MNHKFEKRVKRIYAMLSCFVLVAVMTVCPAFAADDPLARSVINEAGLF